MLHLQEVRQQVCNLATVQIGERKVRVAWNADLRQMHDRDVTHSASPLPTIGERSPGDGYGEPSAAILRRLSAGSDQRFDFRPNCLAI